MSDVTILDRIDEERSLLHWEDVKLLINECLAQGHQSSEVSYVLAVAAAEARLEIALAATNSDGIESVSGLRKVALSICENLNSAGRDMPEDESPRMRKARLECAGTLAHAYLIAGQPEDSLATLDINAKLDDAVEALAYNSFAAGLRARVVRAAALANLGELPEAISAYRAAAKQVEGSSNTREAAIWKARLYTGLLRVIGDAEPAEKEAAKEAHERVLHELSIFSSNGASSQRNGLISKTSSSGAEDQSLRGFGSLSSMFHASETQSLNEAVRAKISTTLSEGDSYRSTRISSQSMRTPISDVSAKTLAQQQLEKQRDLERLAEETTTQWRAAAKPRPPAGLVTGDLAIKLTRDHVGTLRGWIAKTLNSAVLLRLLTEALAALGELEEAFAAFDTYFEYQRLHLEKIKNGINGMPDSEEGCADIFSLMLSAIITRFPIVGYRTVDRAARLAKQLEQVMPQSDPFAVARAHATLARVDMFEASQAVGNDWFKKRFDAARFHMNETKGLVTDPQYLYVYGLSLAHSEGPLVAFPVVRSAAAEHLHYIPLTHLLVKLLTAVDQFESAQAVVETMLREYDPSMAQTSYEKYQLLELKRTHIAVLEARWGVAFALEELPALIELVQEIYPQGEGKKAVETLTRVISGVHARTSSQRRNTITEEPNGLTCGSPRQQRPNSAVDSLSHHRNVPQNRSSHSSLTLGQIVRGSSLNKNTSGTLRLRTLFQPKETRKEPKKGGEIEKLDNWANRQWSEMWLWIAQLYKRGGLLEDAAQAISEAQLYSPLNADMIVMRAQLMLDPTDAYHEYKKALALEPGHLGAALGLFQVIEKEGRVSDGVLRESEPSKIFESAKEEVFEHRALVSLLEDLTTHRPGRHVPEAWYALGSLYEFLGDSENSRIALWHCVRHAEKQAVRRYM